MARWLVVSLLAAGCVIPIPAEPEEQAVAPSRDAGDGFPNIVEANPDFPGIIQITIGSEFPISLTLADSDIDQTLHVRVFREYSKDMFAGPIATRDVPNDPVHGTVVRTPINLDTRTWCNGAPLGNNLVFDVVVADEDFDPSPSATPPFRAVLNNGRIAIRSWVGKCQLPAQ